MKKTRISLGQVKHMANLSGLELTPAELTRFQKQLAVILDYVTEIQAVKTSQAPLVRQATNLKEIVRPDQEGICLKRTEALANAPKKSLGYFVVSPIAEKWH